MSMQDLFYLVSSIVIVWVAIFLTWTLYRLSELLKDTHLTIQNLNNKMEMVDEWVENAKERMAHTASMLSIITQTVKNTFSFADRFKSNKSAKKSAKNSQKTTEDEAE